MELDEKQFITGFNYGYLLAKFEPHLISILLKDVKPFNSYIQGLSSGLKEYELSLTNSQMEELGKLRQKGRDRGSREIE